MRKSTYAILTGTLAFGLTAAAAAGTAFTINSVTDTPGTETATITVSQSPCTGTYDIDWTFDQFGYVTGFSATRTAPTPDPNLEFCASMPAALMVSNGGGSTPSYWYGTTDTSGSILTKTFDVPLIVGANAEVSLQIGPGAGI